MMTTTRTDTSSEPTSGEPTRLVNRRVRRVSAPIEMGLYRWGLPKPRWDTERKEQSTLLRERCTLTNGLFLAYHRSQEGSLVE